MTHSFNLSKTLLGFITFLTLALTQCGTVSGQVIKKNTIYEDSLRARYGVESDIDCYLRLEARERLIESLDEEIGKREKKSFWKGVRNTLLTVGAIEAVRRLVFGGL